MTKLEIIPLEGIPEISPGDDLVEIIGQLDNIQSGDILVVTQKIISCLLYTSPSPRDYAASRMPSSA